MSSIINTFDGDERGRIKHHAAYGNMAALLRVAGFDARMSMEEQFADEGIETPADMVAHYDDAGGFREVSGVGPKGDQKSAAVVELIRTAIVDDDDTPAPSHQATFGSGELELEDTTETDLTAYGVDPDDRKEREPRQDVATSDTFDVDDRELRTATDGGEQVTLGDGPDVEPEEGQATLVDVATDDQEDDDGRTALKSRESALDLLADGSWHPDLIAPAFDVTPQVAASIHEAADRAGDVMRWHDNTDGDLTVLPKIGEASSAAISRTIPKLKSRGVTKHQGDLARYDGEVSAPEPQE